MMIFWILQIFEYNIFCRRPIAASVEKMLIIFNRTCSFTVANFIPLQAFFNNPHGKRRKTERSQFTK
jgi:uncharacterized membrane protein YwzB